MTRRHCFDTLALINDFSLIWCVNAAQPALPLKGIPSSGDVTKPLPSNHLILLWYTSPDVLDLGYFQPQTRNNVRIMYD